MIIKTNTEINKKYNYPIKLFYFDSKGDNRLIINNNVFKIKPGFSIIIPQNTNFQIKSYNSKCLRVYKKSLVIKTHLNKKKLKKIIIIKKKIFFENLLFFFYLNNNLSKNLLIFLFIKKF